MKIEVLDKGHVELMDHMGSDLTVCNAARVSFNKESEWGLDFDAIARLKSCPYNKDDVRLLKEKDEKLIRYLAKHNHWTPFAHPQITLRVKAPVSIRTQFFKHKQGFVENEISRRYVDSEPEFYVPEFRKAVKNKKQGSGEVIDSENLRIRFERNMVSAKHKYEYLLHQNVCPEQARMVLPQNTMTEWYWSGSLDAWSDMCKLRCASDTQEETQEVAKKISVIMHKQFPVSWVALAKAYRNG